MSPTAVRMRAKSQTRSVFDGALGSLCDDVAGEDAGPRGGKAWLRIGLDISFDQRVESDAPRLLTGNCAVFRRVDKKTGQVSFLKYNPPPPVVECAWRAEDIEQTVKGRVSVREAMAAGLRSSFEDQKSLRRVDGVGELSESTSRLFNVLGMNG